MKKQLREAEIEREILKKAALHAGSASSPRATVPLGWQIFQFIKNNDSKFPIEKMCKTFKISKSGYYNWLNKKPSVRQLNNQKILKLIKEIHQESKARYGSPKITQELNRRGVQISRPRVARIMKAANIKSIVHKKFRINTTDSRPC